MTTCSSVVRSSQKICAIFTAIWDLIEFQNSGSNIQGQSRSLMLVPFDRPRIYDTSVVAVAPFQYRAVI